MKIVVLSGSPHKHGTTSKLVDSFIAGAEAAGHEVVRFDTAFMKIHPCIACEKCHTEYGKCVFADDMVQIGNALANSGLRGAGNADLLLRHLFAAENCDRQVLCYRGIHSQKAENSFYFGNGRRRSQNRKACK